MSFLSRLSPSQPMLSTPLPPAPPSAADTLTLEEEHAQHAVFTTSLIQENVSLKSTLMDLNAQLLTLRAEMRSNKSLIHNLKALNAAVAEENSQRVRDGVTLRNKLTETERKLDNALSQVNMLNSNMNRQKKSYSALQTRSAESEKTLREQLAERDKKIAQLEAKLSTTEHDFAEEKKALLAANKKLEAENSELSQSLSERTQQVALLESEKSSLQGEVERLTQKSEKISELVNKELEEAYDSLHQKLEVSLREADAFQRSLLEKQQENEQFLSIMLREGLQIPNLR